ncbi:MAG: tetratricopeptide repeat protein, partial [Armatimonadetes bacterium]|nr:tetratricopeptide repeat protein [Armatimonadota bacterium]
IGLVIACAIAILLTGSFGLGDYYAPENVRSDKLCIDFLSQYRMASRISPLNPKFHRELGWCEAFYGNNLSLAKKELEIAIKLAPTDASNYFVRGLIAAREGDAKKAVRYFRKSLRFNPNSTQTIYQLALVYRAMGDRRKYELSLKRLLGIERSSYEQIRGVPELVDLTYVHAHLYFGEVYERSGNYRAAAAEYEAAISRIERWRSNKMIIDVQRALGELTPEEERRVMRTLRNSYLRLARVCELMGELDCSREAVSKARRIKT